MLPFFIDKLLLCIWITASALTVWKNNYDLI